MANFHTSVKRVLDSEGGFSLHPADRGNYNSRGQLVGTNRGISAPLYEELLRVAPTKMNMQQIGGEEAVAIYRVKFWIPIQGQRIAYQKVADVLLDGTVNHGLHLGIKLMQRCLGVSADGLLGPQSLAAINKHQDPNQLVEDYLRRRAGIYHNDSSSESFLRGWMARLNKFITKSEKHV